MTVVLNLWRTLRTCASLLMILKRYNPGRIAFVFPEVGNEFAYSGLGLLVLDYVISKIGEVIKSRAL